MVYKTAALPTELSRQRRIPYVSADLASTAARKTRKTILDVSAHQGAQPVPDLDTAAMCHQIADTEQSRAVCYFIGADSGPVKIGYASNPKARLQNLREASPYDLRILATVSGGIYRERAYHIQFADRRMRGEWFERCPEILAEIEWLSSPSHRSLDGAVG